MIQVNNVSFSYNRRKNWALKDFSLDLPQGNVLGLLGKNGAGKSTLLHLMCGLLTPDNGKVLFHGVDTRKRLPATLSDLFIVPEEFNLPSMTLENYIRYNAPFYPRFSRDDMRRYLDVFGMTSDVHLNALSMGQKKKIFMAFALATNTSLLLMDEPTNGLDIPGKSEFRKLIAAGMSDERTVLISSHQVRDIDKLLDRILVIDNNRVLLDRSVFDICEHLYFVETDEPALLERSLFRMNSLKGYSVVLPNTDHRESEMNLEVLFNALLEVPEKITACFTR